MCAYAHKLGNNKKGVRIKDAAADEADADSDA